MRSCPRLLATHWDSRSWDLSVWRVIRGRWREADAWAAAGVGSDDIRALKQSIKSHRFEDPIIGIRRISENQLEINVGWLGDPLMGAGTRLTVRLGENGRRIEEQSGWYQLSASTLRSGPWSSGLSILAGSSCAGWTSSSRAATASK